MRTSYYSVVIALMMLPALLNGQEQKFAHVNLGNILELMPEVAAAEAEMEELRDSIVNVYESRVKTLEEEYGQFQRDVAEGNLSRKVQERKAQEFQAEQQKISQFEQQLGQSMERRRQQKLAPILEKVDRVIQEIAEEEGYTMVFDVSSGSMLFAEESKDISGEVLDRLNAN